MTTATTNPSARGAPPAGLPRLLATWRPGAPVGFDEHVAHYGPPPWAGRRRKGTPDLVHTLEASGLRGRGGAGFPTARKLVAVAQARGGRPVVVVNGSEGEPASRKDKLLLAHLPHLVLDGAALAAEAVGADEVIVVVDRWAHDAISGVTHAVDERAARRSDPVTFRLAHLPGRFVSGEETAVVNFVNGGPAKPTFVPPRPFQKGVYGRPTLIQNVETLAHLALVARYGADWYRSVGSPDEPGTALVTVSGSGRASVRGRDRDRHARPRGDRRRRRGHRDPECGPRGRVLRVLGRRARGVGRALESRRSRAARRVAGLWGVARAARQRVRRRHQRAHRALSGGGDGRPVRTVRQRLAHDRDRARTGPRAGRTTATRCRSSDAGARRWKVVARADIPTARSGSYAARSRCSPTRSTTTRDTVVATPARPRAPHARPPHPRLELAMSEQAASGARAARRRSRRERER